MHLPELISDLGFILIVAAIVTLTFRRLGQPVVLGYIVAGFLVGPHIPWIPTVQDTDSIKIWAEIGVIFLLFGLGLEFSFKKLAKVGPTASVTAGVEVAFMMGLGYLFGQILDWSTMDSLFLGGILAISSTTIIVRAFEELGMKSQPFVNVVFGVLVVEDLFAILLMVLLSTVALTQVLSGTELVFSTARLMFFLTLWFLVGIYFLPSMLAKVRKLMNPETLLVMSLGLCLAMVMIATKLGFSPALGAFLMGSLFAETPEGKKIEHIFVPVRDLFGAIFFVSVGMLIDPEVLVKYWDVILIVTALTIVGKLLSSALGCLLSGQSLKVSVQAGLSLAQIGEFSFIIATLGLTLGVISDHLYPIAVSVSAITTFTTPYFIKHSEFIADFLDKNLPKEFLLRFNTYRSALNKNSRGDYMGILWRSYGIKLSLNSVLILAITLSAQKWLLPIIEAQISNDSVAKVLTGFVTLVLCLPFIWAIGFSQPSGDRSSQIREIEILSSLQYGISLFRGLVVIFWIGFVVSQFSSLLALSGLVMLSVALLVLFSSSKVEPLYRKMESGFVTNLRGAQDEPLLPWDVSLVEVLVPHECQVVGQTLEESKIKENFGVVVALIKRGSKEIFVPSGDEMIFPVDRLFVVGEEEQIERFQLFVEQDSRDLVELESEYRLRSMEVVEQTGLLGKSIRNSGLREKTNGLIVGVERHGKRYLNPDPNMILEAQDVIWVVGQSELS